MTVREVALYLRISEATVYKWAKAKKIPGVKVGGIWRFQKGLIEERMSRSAEMLLLAPEADSPTK